MVMLSKNYSLYFLDNGDVYPNVEVLVIIPLEGIFLITVSSNGPGLGNPGVGVAVEV